MSNALVRPFGKAFIIHTLGGFLIIPAFIVILSPFTLHREFTADYLAAIAFSSLEFGLFFGFFMALLWVVIHVGNVSNKKYSLTDEHLRLGHERRLEVPLSFDETFNLCKASVDALPGFKTVAEDYNAGTIKVRKDHLRRYPGEKIVFEIEKNGNKQMIRLSCSPYSWKTFIDGGKNLDNAERINRFIEDRINMKSATSA